MALYEINLKVYVNYDGTLYNKGSKNILRPIYKLSNAVYKLSLITPIAPTNVLYASFQKADGTKTTQQLMAYDGIEVVDGNNWNVYTLNINNNITNVSEKQRDNSLSFDFNVSDGKSTPALLNTEPIVVKCQYSIIGQEVEVSQSDLDQILASVMATLKNRDKDKVFSVAFLPSVVEDETDDNYNVGYVYLLNGKYTAITEIPETPDPNVAYLWNGETRTTAPILVNGKYYRFKDSAWQELVNYSQNKGNIYRAVKGGYAEIARGIEYINSLMTDVENIKNALGDTSQIPSGSTITALVLQNVSDITKLKNDVLDLGALIEQNQNQISTINQSIESINNQLGSLSQRLTTAENDIVSLTNSLNQIGSSVMENTESIASLQGSKLNKDFSDIAIGNTIADNDYVIVNSGGVSYKIVFSKLKELIGSGGGVNHYKGDFISYEALVQAVPVGEPGDYAFVNTENELVMYIWDSDDNTWKETTHGQYVSTATFAEFQQGLITNGTIVANTASNYYTANGNKNIESEFASVRTSIQETTAKIPTYLSDGNSNNVGINLTDDNGDPIGTGFGFANINDKNILISGDDTYGSLYLMEEINLANLTASECVSQNYRNQVTQEVSKYFRNEAIVNGETETYNYNPNKESGCILTTKDYSFTLKSRNVNSSTQVGVYSFQAYSKKEDQLLRHKLVFTIDFSVNHTLTITDITNQAYVSYLPDSLLLASTGTTSGTLTTNNYLRLYLNRAMLIKLSNEYYYLCSDEKTADTLVYANIDYENAKKVNKFIVITKSTKAWVLVQTEDTPTSQGFVDATDLIPSGGNLYGNTTLGDWLDACAEKGYKMVYAFQDFNESGKDNNVVYAIANLPPYNTTKPDWMCWFFKGATDTGAIKGYVYYRARKTFESSKFIWTEFEEREYSFGSDSYSRKLDLKAISYNKNNSTFSSGSENGTYTLDMYYNTINCPTEITSALTELSSIPSSISRCKKIWINSTSNQTINGKALLSKGTILYLNETKSTYTPDIQTFTGGILRDVDENEYEVSIRTPYTGTTTYTLHIIQKVVKITGLPETATNGTFTDYEISTLQNGTKYIEFNNELYELNDMQHTSGYLTFSHLGAENSKHMTKCITITISAKTWVLTTQEVMPVIANPTGDATANLTKVQIGDVIYSIPSGGGGSTELMVSTTYANLVSLKTNSQLQKGVLYRITDYTATTSQPYTRETTNQFDILVRATSENTLDENANAILHSGDTYFANCKLENWVLKYCLTNDSSRFYWADTTGAGKGVVYYLRDEWGNEAPYDFKNIQFQLYKITACPNVPGLVGKYTFSTSNSSITTDNTDSRWTYTFGAYVSSETKMYDMSVEQSKWSNDEGGYNNTCENKIGEYHGPDHSYGPLVLNKTVFLYMDPEDNDYFPPQYNTIGANNYENVFNGYNCTNNVIGLDFTKNTLLGESGHLHVGIGCYFLVSGSYMTNVKFKLNCSNIYISKIVMSSCSFGVSCANNVFSGNGNAVTNFTLEDNCSNLSLTIPSGQTAPLSKVYVEAGTNGFLSSAVAKIDIYDSQMANNESPITISRDSNDKLLMLWQSDGRTQGCKTKSVSSYTNWTATDDSAKPYATKEYVDSHSGSKEVVSKAITSANDIANVTFTAEEWTKLKAGADLVFTYLTVTYLAERVMNLLPNPLVNNDNIFYKLHQVNFAEDTDRVYEGYIYIAQNSDGTAGVTKMVFLATPLRYSYSAISIDSWVESTEVSGYGYSLTLDYSGITNTTFVDVYFSVADASSGNFAPFVKTSGGQFTIYAKTKPTSAISFDVIINF